MSAPQIQDYLKYANLQMAAEALYDFDATKNNVVPGTTYQGNVLERFLTTGNLHASRFTAPEAEKLAKDWVVEEHISNTKTGFSGTLFKAIRTDATTGVTAGDLVLSFRSTEFIDDAARDNEATNKLEIQQKGFAFGQLADMEDWYASLKANGKILPGQKLDVTGYSLGGHLATVFNLLHGQADIKQVVTFNGAGVGRIEGGIQNLGNIILYFNGLRKQSSLETYMQSDLGKDTYRALKQSLTPTFLPKQTSSISKRLRQTFMACGAALVLLGGSAAAQADDDARQARLKAGQALFEEKCRTVAGEKIYRKVQDVEGIVLLKVRPQAGPAEWSDPMWAGAAFAGETFADGYITSFLGYEQSSSPNGEPVTPTQRGYINTDYRPDNPSNLPGYRYVDIPDPQDGKRYRYRGRWEEPWQYDKSYLKGYIKFFLDKTLAPTPAPRYGVTYEDHVIAEERALGLASSTVKVLDLQSGEVLGEMTGYAYAPGRATGSNPHPWLRAYKCYGPPKHRAGTDAMTRKFVDQILIPKKDK